jgi:hypothetical protein
MDCVVSQPVRSRKVPARPRTAAARAASTASRHAVVQRGENLRVVVPFPMKPARRRSDDGRAVGSVGEAAACVAYSSGEARLKRHCGAWREFAIPWVANASAFFCPPV